MKGAIPLPKLVRALVALYFLASLAHFAHNAEFIAFYPGMPASLTRETVYLAWLGVTTVGALGFGLARLGHHAWSAVLVAAWGALGIDGLAHYTLALCSEHTLATNLTIAAEVATGSALLLVSAVRAWRAGRLRFARQEARPCAHFSSR